MYTLKPGIKSNPAGRWALPDRIFFGHGACHILAGTYLRISPLAGFHADRIIPKNNLPGNHIFVSNGDIAFDYHGYSRRSRLLDHHRRCWLKRHDDWECVIEPVAFDLLSTLQLNARKMLGPDQYLWDPIRRAEAFLEKINHPCAAAQASARADTETCGGQQSLADNPRMPSRGASEA